MNHEQTDTLKPRAAGAWLSLGTVQFGLDYGIANRTGRPSFEAICAILRRAHEAGVAELDTAASYGNAEEILGRALAATGLQETFPVVTKVGELPAGLGKAEAAKRIRASVETSLRLLQVPRLEACLFHRETNGEYADELHALVGEGLIKAAGVSFVSPAAARSAVGRAAITRWQVPANVLDSRFLRDGLAAAARTRGVVVVARSVFFQGLLLMNEAEMPAGLRSFAPFRRQAADLAKAAGMTLGEFALRAMTSQPQLDGIVVGAETLDQVEENLRLFAKGPLPADLLRQIPQAYPGMDERLLDPSQWPK